MKNPYLLCALSIPLFFCSCIGRQYVASPHYVPLHKEKGEISCSIGQRDFQLGYSLTNHLLIFTSGKYREVAYDLEGLDMNREASQDRSYELGGGAGYFKSFHKILSFETLCGTAFGKLSYQYERGFVQDLHLFDMNTRKYNIYIQQNIGVTIKRYFEFAISAKLIKYELYNINCRNNVDFTTDSYVDVNTYFIGKQKASYTFFEPGFTFRVGFHNWKAQLQGVWVSKLSNNPIYYRDTNVFLSVNMNLDILKKSKEDKKSKANLLNKFQNSTFGIIQ